MPKPSLKATVTTTVTQQTKVKPQLAEMLRERCEESVKLNKQAAEIKARKKRLGAEVEKICKDAGLTKDLTAGFDFEGHPLKLVAGMSSKWNKKKMILDGIDPEDYIEQTPKAAYVRIGKGHDDE